MLRLVFLVLSVVLLIWLLDKVGWEKIAEYAMRLGWSGVAIIVALGVVEGLFDAVAFQKVVSEPVSLFYMNVVNQSGAFMNRIIPWEAGEVLKGALLKRRVSAEAAISGTIISNYVFKFSKPIATLVASILAWLFGTPELAYLAGWMILASILAFLPYVVYRILVRIGMARIFVWLVRVTRIVRRDPEQLVKKARNIDEVVRTFSKKNRAAYIQTILFQILGRFSSWVTIYVVLYFIGESYDFPTTGMIWAGFMVMGYFITVLPAKLGATEASGWLLFKMLGLDPGVGLLTQCIMSLKALVVNGGTALLINFCRGKEDTRDEEAKA